MLKKLKSVKAFAMAELLAVCVAMLAIFSILFSNYLPLVAEYENRISYNDVTSEYAAFNIRKLYLNNNIDQLSDFLKTSIGQNGYYTIYKSENGVVTDNLCANITDIDEKNICSRLMVEYKVEEAIITNYRLDGSNGVKNKYKSGSLLEYINYLPNYNNSYYSGDREKFRIILKTSYGYATSEILINNEEDIDINYNVGDIVTLKDNSKWFYLSSNGVDVNLLSVYFVNHNGVFVESSNDAYTMSFSSNNNSDYELSDIKKFVDDTVLPYFKQNLINSGVSDNITNNIRLSIPDASIISRVSGIDTWSYSSTGSFNIESPNKYFIANPTLSYWTNTARTTKQVWIVNMYYKLWYGSANYENDDGNSFGIRPMLTVKMNNLKSMEKIIEDPELSLISSPKYLIYDVNKKKVILEKNDNPSEKWYPASVTKLTTLIVAINEMERLQISLDDEVLITDEIMDLILPGESLAGFKVGDIVTYRDLLYGVIHKSGSDACFALAIYLCGNEENFVKLMNDYASEHDMNDTHYTNTRGLINTNHYTTLKDVAVLFAAAMQNDIFRGIVKPIEYTTSNGLVFALPEFGDLEYLIGLKNGHSVLNGVRTGYNQANYYKKGNQEYVVVTSSDPSDTNKEHRTLDNYYIWKYLFDS